MPTQKLDKMVMEANTETDPAKRAAILQKVEAMLIDDAAYVPLHWEDLPTVPRRTSTSSRWSA